MRLRSIGLGVSPLALALALALAIGSTATPAISETTQAQPATTVGELIVTAEKREQRLQDVPMSVSAVTGAEILERGVTSLTQLQYSVPDLSLVEYGPGVDFIQIRGVSSSIGSPTISAYLDEAPIYGGALDSTTDVRLLDIDRIEVLRGPQGTLYGEGSMGGTIRYITGSPNLEQYSGSAEGEWGRVDGGADSYKIDGVLNIPIISDTLGLRLVAGDERDGGWINDPATGQSNINGSTIETLRGTILWKPTDKLSLSLLVQHDQINQENQNFGTNAIINSVVPSFYNIEYTLVNGTLSYNFGPVTILESFAFMNKTDGIQYDLTSTYLPILEYYFGVPPGAITKIPLDDIDNHHVYSNELRLSSNGKGPFNWTFGGIVRRASIGFDEFTSTYPLVLPITLISATGSETSQSFAIFGEANYQLTSKLNLLVGLRYFQDSETTQGATTSLGFTTNDADKATFSSLDPRFNVRYEFSPTSMVYFNAAEGFRSGGFNSSAIGSGSVTVPLTYAPDSIWTYEVGTKQLLFDRKLEFDGAVYYNDWKGVQSEFIPAGQALAIVENGGTVSGWGTDLSLVARPVEGLTLTGSYSWNNMAYTSISKGQVDKAVGDPVDLAVRESYSVSLDYRHPIIADAVGFFRVDYQHSGQAQDTVRDYTPPVIAILPARDTVNLRLGADFGRYEVSVFANNALNDRTPIIVGPFGVIPTDVEQTPRTIGVNVKAHF